MLHLVQNFAGHLELENRLIDLSLCHIIYAKCAVAVFCKVLVVSYSWCLLSELRTYCKFICYRYTNFLEREEIIKFFLGAEDAMKLSNYNCTESF